MYKRLFDVESKLDEGRCDTLIGYEIPAYRKEVKRKILQAPRFYYFDVGLANYLMGRHSLKRGTDDYGHAFEHLVMQEIIAYKGYNDKKDVISYWRTYDRKEVGTARYSE